MESLVLVHDFVQKLGKIAVFGWKVSLLNLLARKVFW